MREREVKLGWIGSTMILVMLCYVMSSLVKKLPRVEKERVQSVPVSFVQRLRKLLRRFEQI